MSNKCLACGNNPISHWSERLNASIELILIPIGLALNRLKLQSALNGLAELIIRLITNLLIFFNVARYTDDPDLTISPRAQVLKEEAKKRNIKMEVLVVGKQVTDNFRARLKNRTIYFMSLPRPYETPALVWIDDKARLKKLFQKYEIPAPAGLSSNKYEDILKCFENLHKPVIVKPRLGSRGRHTTLFVNTAQDLAEAFKLARQLCPEVIIEEQLFGAVYRGTVINGKLVGVLKGEQPQITGDSKKNIYNLINEMNSSRPRGVNEFIISENTREFLKRQNVTLETILPMNQKVLLSEKIGVSYGGRSEEVTAITHPKILEILEKAARLINDPILGFDFIIPSVSISPDEQKWGIIECNTVPFINLHHHPLIGTPNNVARHIWDLFT